MISIVICTSNRAEKLYRCIHELEGNTKDFDQTPELLVVDNHSSDDTRLVVKEFTKSCSLRIKYIYEDRKGLSYARNTGVREAAFPVIAFTDDDCIPERNWMTVIQAEFRTDPSLAILGGRVDPLEPSDLGLGMRQFSQRTQIRSYNLLSKFMIGCNFAVNRKVFEAVGPFDTGLGRGTQIDSGEDRDFLYRALKKGFKIVYSPNMLVYHGHGRHTEKEIQNCRKSYAKGRGAFYCKQIMGGDRVILRKAVSEIFHLSKKSLWYGTEDVRRTKPLKVLCHLTFGAFYQFRQGMRSQRE